MPSPVGDYQVKVFTILSVAKQAPHRPRFAHTPSHWERAFSFSCCKIGRSQRPILQQSVEFCFPPARGRGWGRASDWAATHEPENLQLKAHCEGWVPACRDT